MLGRPPSKSYRHPDTTRDAQLPRIANAVFQKRRLRLPPNRHRYCKAGHHYLDTVDFRLLIAVDLAFRNFWQTLPPNRHGEESHRCPNTVVDFQSLREVDAVCRNCWLKLPRNRQRNCEGGAYSSQVNE